MRNDVETLLNALIANGDGDVNGIDTAGRPPLYYAAWYGYTKYARILIDAGADVSKADFNQSTPLHPAALCNRPDIIQLLLDNGANVNAVNSNGDSPLHYACARGFLLVAQMLIRAGSQLDTHNINGYTPLDEAIGNVCFEFLLDAGAKLSAREYPESVHLVLKKRRNFQRAFVVCCGILKRKKNTIGKDLVLIIRNLIYKSRFNCEWE